jgi:hypothetical protein
VTRAGLWRRGQRRTGIALVAVLAALALLAVLTAGSLATTSALRSGARLGIAGAQAMTATEFALEISAPEWRQRGVSALAVGGTASWSHGASGGGGSVTVTRVSPTLLWMVAEGRGRPDALRRVGRVLRLPDLPFDSLGVVTAAGAVVVGSGVTFAPPTAGESLCGAAVLNRIVVPPGQTVRNPSGSTVTNPATAYKANDVTLYTTIDRLSSQYLGLISQVSLPANTSIVLDGPSQLMYAAGPVSVTGGTGTGILYVDGPLAISGQTTFSGLIVATGGVTMSEGPTSITGIIISGVGADLTHPATTTLTGIATLRPDLCEVRTTLQSLIPPRPVGGRSWGELY